MEMKLLLLVVLLFEQGFGQDVPGPNLGLLASQCRLLINTPQDIPAAPDGFSISEESGISFLIDHQADELHAHFAPGDTDDQDLLDADLEFEVTVTQTEDGAQIAQMTIGTAMWAAHANSLHIPIPEVTHNSVVETQVVVIYHLQDGTTVLRSPVGLFPTINTGECCPLGHPQPSSSPPNPVWTGSITEGDIFADSGSNTWSYWCHNGEWKSCFMLPDGFSDPNNERFTAIGEVAALIDDSDGSEVQFRCTFRPDGDEAGSTDNRDVELSGGFERIVTPDVLQDPPPAQAGILTSVCEVTFASEIDVPASPPDFHVIEISDAVSDAFNVIVNPLDQADRFHVRWDFPLLPPSSGLTLTGYEISAVQEGSVQEIATVNAMSFETTATISVSDANTGSPITVSITAVYVDSDGQQHRSETTQFPPATRACCPGNHPIPRALPDPVDYPINGETAVDGEFYVADSNGNSFTYFCHDGRYKSCGNIPDGFNDPNNERYQEVGGTAIFLDESTGAMTEFLCQLSENGDVGNSVHPNIKAEISGKYQKFFSISTDTVTTTEAPEDVAGLNVPKSNTLFYIIIVTLGGLLLASLFIIVVLRKKQSHHVELATSLRSDSVPMPSQTSDLTLDQIQYKRVEEA